VTFIGASGKMEQQDSARIYPDLKLGWWHRFYIRLFWLEEWAVGALMLPAGGLAELLGTVSLTSISWRPRSRAAFLADPFVWERDGEPRVMMEEFDYFAGRGRISSVSLTGLLRQETTREEMLAEFHLSYPHVFKANGSWYCTPEGAEGGNVDLHIWDATLDRWTYRCRLLSGVKVFDPTIIFHENCWYLFGTLANDEPRSKLRIWWSDSLEGTWRPHRCDPVHIAVDQVRSAGKIFQIDGRWYRPSQDCRRSYGHGLIINRIDVLSPTDYRETPVRYWYPLARSLYPDGLHTISITERAVVVDGKRFRFSPFAPGWKVWWRICTALRRARVG
jgi:hypothetical protein